MHHEQRTNASTMSNTITLTPRFSLPSINSRRYTFANSITCERPAPADLKILSVPEGASLWETQGYYYDSSAGQGTMVYVIEEGADTRIPVSDVKLTTLEG